MEKPKMSKELKDIEKAIENYINKHHKKGNEPYVALNIFSIDVKDKDFPVVDDYVIEYGRKEILSISLEDQIKEMKNGRKN